MTYLILAVLAVYLLSLIWIFVFAERVARWLDNVGMSGLQAGNEPSYPPTPGMRYQRFWREVPYTASVEPKPDQVGEPG